MKDEHEINQNRRIEQAAAGDEKAMGRLFSEIRDRLKRMVELRLDQRIQGRVDASDVLQEAYVDLVQQLPGYARDPKLPFFLWMRSNYGGSDFQKSIANTWVPQSETPRSKSVWGAEVCPKQVRIFWRRSW